MSEERLAAFQKAAKTDQGVAFNVPLKDVFDTIRQLLPPQ